MANKKPEEGNFIELIKKIWSPIAGFLGAITLLINSYQLWLGNQALITYILAGGGFLFLVIALLWVGFSKTEISKRGNRKTIKNIPRYSLLYRRIAWSILFFLSLLAFFGVNILIQYRAEQENKLIVLIAEFEGPEDVYGLRNEIIENLYGFSGDENIKIIPMNKVVTLSMGREHARQLGEKYLADIVIWGWYRPTENPNITIHIENLSPEQLISVNENSVLRPASTLAELESFSFQQQVGQETNSLILFLVGYINYNNANHELALEYFNKALQNLPETPRLFQNQYEIYFYRGNSNGFLGDYQLAVQDYDQALQINPQLTGAYVNRGLAYANLGDHQLAIQDYSQALQINPQLARAYNNRGISYSDLGDYQISIQDYDLAIQINPRLSEAYNNRGVSYANLYDYEQSIQSFELAIQVNPKYGEAYYNLGIVYADLGDHQRAIQSFDQAIQINPQFAEAYSNRGNVHIDLGDYQRAIQDFDQAIQINPQLAGAYGNRGNVYSNLGNYQRAIQDYSQVIQINPQDAQAYNNRGLVYAKFLGDYQRAIQDFDQAIQINLQYANAYYNRGLAYQALGKNTEAEADFAKYKELTGQDAP